MMDLNADSSKRILILGYSLPWMPSPIASLEILMLDCISEEQARATSIDDIAGIKAPKFASPNQSSKISDQLKFWQDSMLHTYDNVAAIVAIFLIKAD